MAVFVKRAVSTIHPIPSVCPISSKRSAPLFMALPLLLVATPAASSASGAATCSSTPVGTPPSSSSSLCQVGAPSRASAATTLVPPPMRFRPLRFWYQLGAAVDLRLGLPDLDHRHGGFSHGPGGIEVRTRYFGSSPGTHLASLHFADVEQMALYGPVRYNGAMEAAKGGTLGSCTLCSEKGCDAATVEDFPGERFTSKVSTTGRMVCLIETGQAPPDDCPGP